MVTEGFTANYQDLHVDKHLDLGRGVPFEVKNKTILIVGGLLCNAVGWVYGYMYHTTRKED